MPLHKIYEIYKITVARSGREDAVVFVSHAAIKAGSKTCDL